MYPTLASFNKMKILLLLLCLVSIYGANECLDPTDGVEHCGLCDEDEPTECFACKDGKFPSADGSTCEIDCPSDMLEYKITGQGAGGDETWGKCVTEADCTGFEGYSPVVADNECKKCAQGCTGCNKDHYCTACGNNKYVKGNAECVTETACIGDSHFLTASTPKTCQPCHGTCKTCSGGNIDNCLTCETTEEAKWLEDNKCVEECDPDYWIYKAEYKCFESEDDCPHGYIEEPTEEGKLCKAPPSPPPPQPPAPAAFGGYLFSGLAIVLALLTFI